MDDALNVSVDLSTVDSTAHINATPQKAVESTPPQNKHEHLRSVSTYFGSFIEPKEPKMSLSKSKSEYEMPMNVALELPDHTSFELSHLPSYRWRTRILVGMVIILALGLLNLLFSIINQALMQNHDVIHPSLNYRSHQFFVGLMGVLDIVAAGIAFVGITARTTRIMKRYSVAHIASNIVMFLYTFIVFVVTCSFLSESLAINDYKFLIWTLLASIVQIIVYPAWGAIAFYRFKLLRLE
jgi:hypothetical protein